MKSTQSKRVRQNGRAGAAAEQAQNTSDKQNSSLTAADAELMREVLSWDGQRTPAFLSDWASGLEEQARALRRAANIVRRNPDAWDAAEESPACRTANAAPDGVTLALKEAGRAVARVHFSGAEFGRLEAACKKTGLSLEQFLQQAVQAAFAEGSVS